MAINVYWSCLENESLRSKEPEPLLKTYYNSDIYDPSTNISKCPSFNDYFKNVFCLKSIYDYSFTYHEGTQVASTSFFDQDFFDKHVIVRSRPKKMFSFTTKFVFFTEEKSLLMSAEMPSLIENNLVNNLMWIPGQFDIGRWYRNIDFAFYMKNGIDSFDIKEGDIFYQLRFHTNEKINFIKFYENDKLKSFRDLVIDSKKYKIKNKGIEDYYNMFDLKKKIIKEIKKNSV